MGGVWTFLARAARLAVALFLACLLLAVVAWGYFAWKEQATEQARLPLATRKDWKLTFVGDTTATLRTAWRDRSLYYQLEIPDFASADFTFQDNAQITMEFSDFDGFKLFEQQVRINDMNRTVGPDNVPTGLTWSGDSYQDPDRYQRVGSVSLAWRGIAAKKPAPVVTASSPEPPPRPTPQAAWRERANWRRLVYGQSENAVREILGEPTQIDRYSATGAQWRYGDIVRGGTVSFGGAGVSRWQEPD